MDENRELVVEIVRIDEKSRSLSIPANLTSQTKRTSLNVPVCEMKAEEKVLKTRRSVYPKSVYPLIFILLIRSCIHTLYFVHITFFSFHYFPKISNISR